MNSPEPSTAPPVPSPQLVTYTNIIYALHALAVLVGVTTATFVVTAFIAGLPSIVAVVMNYLRRSETAGTYLESHFRWQIRTFWFAVLAFAVMSIVAIPLVLMILTIQIALAGFGAIGLWVIYRVARGWLALREGRAMYA